MKLKNRIKVAIDSPAAAGAVLKQN